jgi:hypothetical protein
MTNKSDSESFDFDGVGVKRIKHPLIKQAQARYADAQTKLLDVDVSTWLTSQDSTTKQHINEMIRHAMALKA